MKAISPDAIRRTCRLRPSTPDFRDYAADLKHPVLKSRPKEVSVKLPTATDNAIWDSPVKDQGYLGSCGPCGIASLVESFERRAFSAYIPVSRLFLYKVTRALLGWEGDSGTDGRTLMKALALFGAPDEQYWTYTDDADRFDIEPPAFVYAMGANYKAIQYQRLDIPGLAAGMILNNMKKLLSRGCNLGLGFTVYESIADAGDGDIPYPAGRERVEGGHFVEVCGYDDTRRIGDDVGTLKIKNSWGGEWGEGGYGHLPYRYLREGQAWDIWTILKQSWIDLKMFDQ